jgi:hypothetical protein
MTNAAPRVSVTMHQHGKRISEAAPGSTVAIEVKVRQTHPGPLHYRWTTDGPGLVPADAPAVTMKLPETPAAKVFVKITNDNGGFLDLSIAVPMKTTASPEADQPLGILDDNGMLIGILDDNGMLLGIMGDNANLFSILNDNGSL